MSKQFIIEVDDKELVVFGPGIMFAIDYDDVDHKEVLKTAEKLVRILNIHW